MTLQCEIRDVLEDAGVLDLPDDIIQKIAADQQVHDDYETDGMDTCLRELVYSKLSFILGVEVLVPNMHGGIGSHEWPRYGDPQSYEFEWTRQMRRAVAVVGGRLDFE